MGKRKTPKKRVVGFDRRIGIDWTSVCTPVSICWIDCNMIRKTSKVELETQNLKNEQKCSRMAIERRVPCTIPMVYQWYRKEILLTIVF